MIRTPLQSLLISLVFSTIKIYLEVCSHSTDLVFYDYLRSLKITKDISNGCNKHPCKANATPLARDNITCCFANTHIILHTIFELHLVIYIRSFKIIAHCLPYHWLSCYLVEYLRLMISSSPILG